MAKSGDSASPSSPPSPPGTTSGTLPIVPARPLPAPGAMVRSRALSRSEMTAVPSGRKTVDHGSCSSASICSATVGRSTPVRVPAGVAPARPGVAVPPLGGGAVPAGTSVPPAVQPLSMIATAAARPTQPRAPADRPRNVGGAGAGFSCFPAPCRWLRHSWSGPVRRFPVSRATGYCRVRRGGRKPAASACAADRNQTSARVSS